jgi:peptide-methionine (S)-S-oxide reductase
MFHLRARQRPSSEAPERTLPARPGGPARPAPHAVLGVPILPPYPAGVEIAIFGMGCFWGAERIFWEASGIHATAVGYAGGTTPNPTYEEVCSGRTGHAEVVLVAFRGSRCAEQSNAPTTTYAELLRLFWEGHDPTQGMRQGNDVGSQYRSLIIALGREQHELAIASLGGYQRALVAAGRGTITTEVRALDCTPESLPEKVFFAAEEYHQQYLAKNPLGYCGLGGTGIACPAPAELRARS